MNNVQSRKLNVITLSSFKFLVNELAIEYDEANKLDQDLMGLNVSIKFQISSVYSLVIALH
jgi:hypothetical protein